MKRNGSSCHAARCLILILLSTCITVTAGAVPNADPLDELGGARRAL